MSFRARLHRDAWVPPSNGAYVRKGANVSKMVDWVKQNKIKVIVGAAVIVAIIVIVVMGTRKTASVAGATAYRLRNAIGAAAQEAPINVATTTTATTSAPVTVATTAPTTVTTTVPTSKANSCDVGIPVAIDVYQDNLGSANDMTMGPGVTTAGVAGLPIDYAGACSGINPAAVWQSSQLLPSNCGQSLQGTDDWSLYAPSNPQVVNFLSAGYNFGQDTVMTTLKNASTQLRPDVPICSNFQSPWNQSSWVDNSLIDTDWSHSLIA